MNSAFVRSAKGFTLIEVLIALVVAVIGILAMIQLSGAFLKSVSEADQRTVAYALAERTLENLRGFDSLTGSAATETYFEDISTSSTANLTVSSGQATYNFDVEWTVTDNIVSGGVVTTTASGPIYQKLKQVDVVVSWVQPEAGSISMSSLIGGIDPNAAALVTDDLVNVGGSTPDVNYNPGVAPDVIAIDVDDGKLKETTKPLPDVDNKNESTEVRFETITYQDTDNDQLIQEDFLMVNCICTLDATVGTNNGLTPTYQKFISENLGTEDKLGVPVNAISGTATALGGGLSQSEYCGRCCAYHHDSDDNTTGVKYKTGASLASGTNGDHVHYKITDRTTEPVTLAPATATGDIYLEACRFKRVDGIYRLAADWKILEVNVFKDSYLASGATGLTNYVNYVKDAVQSELYNNQVSGATPAQKASSATPTLAPTRDFNTTDGQSNQVLSRTIYLDSIVHDTQLQSYLAGFTTGSMAEQKWLQFIPFYEINTTLLSTWDSSSTAIATVTSEDIDNITDEATNYYGTYSRGLVVGSAGVGSTTITATMQDGNTGVLGNTYANPSTLKGKDNRIVPLPVEYRGTLSVANGQCTASSCFISGIITKNYSGNNPAKFSDISFLNTVSTDPSLVSGDVAIHADGTGSSSDGACSFGLNTGTQISYSCEVDPSSNGGTWNGDIELHSEGSVFVITVTGNTGLSVSSSSITNLNFALAKP